MTAHIKEPQIAAYNVPPITTPSLIARVLLRDVEAHSSQFPEGK